MSSESTNLSKIKREKLLETISKIKENINDDEVLKNLSQIEFELTRKKFGLIWEEHKERVDEELETNIPIFEEVKKNEIVNNENDKFNFLLEGDNLHSLYLLEKTHKEKVDVIYIDPPYNTGKEDFVYNDKYIDELDGYMHSKWLSFMNKRLSIAKNLLKNDGIIMISIDDNEYAQLKLLCDDIFGVENLLSVQHIQVRYADKTLNEKNDWQPVMEYVLIYAKKKENFNANKPKEDYSIDKFIYEFKELTNGYEFEVKGRKVTVFKKGEWQLIKHKTPAMNLLKETWVSGSIYTGTGNGTMVQNVIEPRVEIDGYGSLYKIDGLGEDGLGYRYFTGPQKEGATRSKMFSGVPIKRSEEMDSGESVKYKSIPNFHDFSADFGNIRHEGGVGFNSGKKPVKMLKQFINFHPNKNAIVLDFFAGSGSTGQAVLDLNKDDNGNRTFILCTNNENKICEEVTYPRIRNVINGYGKYSPLPCNLKYYRTGFVPKINTDEDNLYENLLADIKNLVQLENGVNINNKEIRIFLTEEEIDEFSVNAEEVENCKIIYISSDVLLTNNQKELFEQNGIDIFTIPEYYFDKEIKEVQ